MNHMFQGRETDKMCLIFGLKLKINYRRSRFGILPVGRKSGLLKEAGLRRAGISTACGDRGPLREKSQGLFLCLGVLRSFADPMRRFCCSLKAESSYEISKTSLPKLGFTEEEGSLSFFRALRFPVFRQRLRISPLENFLSAHIEENFDFRS